MEKRCTKCQEPKVLTEFNKDVSKKDGHRSQCRMCQRNGRKPERSLKRCKVCKKEKPFNEFYRNYKGPTGCQPWCIKCTKKHHRERRGKTYKFKNDIFQDVCRNLPEKEQRVVVKSADKIAGICKGISSNNALDVLVAIGHWMEERNITGADLREKYDDSE